MISGDTWAIVAATGLGPIFAVLITFWRDARNSLRTRRLWVFLTLMATRRVNISPEHVNALNLVEVDFYACEMVQKHWKIYKDHLFFTGEEDDAWREKKERLWPTCCLRWLRHYDLTSLRWRFSRAVMPPRDGSTGRAVKLKQWNIFTNFPQARKLCRYGFAV